MATVPLTLEDLRTAGLADVDPDVAALLERELERQRGEIELIASENFTWPAMLEAVGSIPTNKYSEGYPGRRYYGGCEVVDEIEQLAIDRAKALFGAEHANVQPHAGAQTNMAVYFAALQPGETILSLELSHGGHLTHGLGVNFSGRLYDIAHYGVDRQLIEAVKAQARALKCVRLETTTTAGEAALRVFQDMNAQPVANLQRYSLPARTGQGLYQSVVDTTADAKAIAGWTMPLGRGSSARQAWEMHWLPTWDVLTPLRERTHRLRFSASGQEAYVVFQRGLYDPRVVEIACWTPRILSNALLMALRDWSHREGYRTLSLLVPEDVIKALGGDAEADGYTQTIWMLGV